MIERSLDLLGTIGVLSLAVAGGTLCLVGLLRGGWRLAIGTGCAMLLAILSTESLKTMVFARPVFVADGDTHGYTNSLPSGHATVAMSLAVGVTLVVPARYRWLAATSALVYAVVVGISTITAGWHRPSDVMAGYLVAAFWGALVSVALLKSRERHTATRILDRCLAERRDPLLRSMLMVGGCLLASALGALFGVVLNDAWHELGEAELNAAYVAGIAATAGTGIAVMGALLTWLAGVDLAELVE